VERELVATWRFQAWTLNAVLLLRFRVEAVVFQLLNHIPISWNICILDHPYSSSGVSVLMNKLTLMLISLALASCTTYPDEQVTSNDQRVCEKVTPTGSNLPVTRCRSRAQIERERADSEMAKQSIRGSGATVGDPRSGRN
jgi:hypothetical protein